MTYTIHFQICQVYDSHLSSFEGMLTRRDKSTQFPLILPPNYSQLCPLLPVDKPFKNHLKNYSTFLSFMYKPIITFDKIVIPYTK